MVQPRLPPFRATNAQTKMLVILVAVAQRVIVIVTRKKSSRRGPARAAPSKTWQVHVTAQLM